jgi:hypothetical protein
MVHGGGLVSRSELQRVLDEMMNEDSPSTVGSFLSTPHGGDEIDLVRADYLQRQTIDSLRIGAASPEEEMFAQLVRATAARTIRKIVNSSRWLRGSRLGLLLWERPKSFLATKEILRFPKSRDKQIEFLARSMGALLAGYRPNTGYKYLATLVQRCEYCGEKPAIIDLSRQPATDELKSMLNPTVGSSVHTAEQCRYSTWPCPLHHPATPQVSSKRWCGTC